MTSARIWRAPVGICLITEITTTKMIDSVKESDPRRNVKMVSPAKAIAIYGIAIMASQMRMAIVSNQPPRQPAIPPMSICRIRLKNTVPSAIMIDSRAPNTMRENRSRPSWSVPRRNFQLGDSRSPPTNWSS